MHLASHIYTFLSTFLIFLHLANAWGGFHTSCTHINVSGTLLSARCKNPAGKEHPTSIDLNKCLANYNGFLACARNFNGQYSHSCRNCGVPLMTQYMYECKCAPQYANDAINLSAKSISTAVAPSLTFLQTLDECVANYGGNLACAKPE
ncbi:hypothetical protein FRC12_017364 [Ceratobasidium sp. 428]|nr:hypothetical protein FRC12_017364 [Ceratobasidium sp. 428]